METEGWRADPEARAKAEKHNYNVLATREWRALPSSQCEEDDSASHIAKRTCEWYERRSRQNGQTVQDWLHAEWGIKMGAKR